jgi:protein-tyrosine phosphatase
LRALIASSLLAALACLTVACGPGDLYQDMPAHVERRHVQLDGAQNFRDLGGYPTEDGRHVRWGLFFRSDKLSDLSDRDLDEVRELGLKLVCDFRTPYEREEDPDRLPEPNPPEVALLEIGDESFAMETLQEKISSGDLGDTDLRQMLTDANRLFASQFAPQYQAMLDRLTVPENLPALVHCTGGKDRAGFASAVILRTLGVPEDIVFEDFLLTNHYTANKIEQTLWLIRVISLFRVDPDAVRPILGVERGYLEAAFDEIRKQHGSFDDYRRSALGVDDARVATFRDFALE